MYTSVINWSMFGSGSFKAKSIYDFTKSSHYSSKAYDYLYFYV